MPYKSYLPTALFNGTEFLYNHTITVTSEGVVHAIEPEQNVPDAVKMDGIICAAFVNAHCHLELSHLHQIIPQKTGLVGFIEQILACRQADDTLISKAALQADGAMYVQGIQAVVDISNTAITAPIKKQSSVRYYTCVETSGFHPAIAETRFTVAEQVWQLFTEHGLLAGIVPHAPYSVSTELFQLIRQAGAALQSIHNQETAAEHRFFMEKQGDFLQLYQHLGVSLEHFSASGKSSIETITPQLATDRPFILVHNTFTTEEDVAFIKNHFAQPYFCICANANLYIENSLPNIPLLVSSAIPILLGTDSLASNHTLSIAEEIKTLTQFFPEISLQVWLQAATYNGARAMGLEHELGKLAVGKQPGIVCLHPNFSVTRLA